MYHCALGGLSAVAKPTPVLILAADPWLGIGAQSGSTQAQSSGSLQVIHRQQWNPTCETGNSNPDTRFGLINTSTYYLPTQQPVGGHLMILRTQSHSLTQLSCFNPLASQSRRLPIIASSLQSIVQPRAAQRGDRACGLGRSPCEVRPGNTQCPAQAFTGPKQLPCNNPTLQGRATYSTRRQLNHGDLRFQEPP